MLNLDYISVMRAEGKPCRFGKAGFVRPQQVAVNVASVCDGLHSTSSR